MKHRSMWMQGVACDCFVLRRRDERGAGRGWRRRRRRRRRRMRRIRGIEYEANLHHITDSRFEKLHSKLFAVLSKVSCVSFSTVFVFLVSFYTLAAHLTSCGWRRWRRRRWWRRRMLTTMTATLAAAICEYPTNHLSVINIQPTHPTNRSIHPTRQPVSSPIPQAFFPALEWTLASTTLCGRFAIATRPQLKQLPPLSCNNYLSALRLQHLPRAPRAAPCARHAVTHLSSALHLGRHHPFHPRDRQLFRVMF
jgi:hypothetical protein